MGQTSVKSILLHISFVKHIYKLESVCACFKQPWLQKQGQPTRLNQFGLLSSITLWQTQCRWSGTDWCLERITWPKMTKHTLSLSTHTHFLLNRHHPSLSLHTLTFSNRHTLTFPLSTAPSLFNTNSSLSSLFNTNSSLSSLFNTHTHSLIPCVSILVLFHCEHKRRWTQCYSNLPGTWHKMTTVYT